MQIQYGKYLFKQSASEKNQFPFFQRCPTVKQAEREEIVFKVLKEPPTLLTQERPRREAIV